MTRSARPRTRRRLGQHFLEPAWARRVVDAIQPGPDDRFLEIGPGRGALTMLLAAQAACVLAVEIDRDLAHALAERRVENVRVITGDFLTLDLEELRRTTDSPSFRIVGNLPYYVVTPILFKILQLAGSNRSVSDAVLMVQREVADRLLARPGTKEYGRLTIHVALQAEVTRLLLLPPGAFRPAPRVASTLIRLRFQPSPVNIADHELLCQLVAGLFGQRRKTLRNALRPLALTHSLRVEEVLARTGLSGTRRPETLDLDDLAAIVDVFVSA